MKTVATVTFPDVEELDAHGPWEGLSFAAALRKTALRVYTVAEKPGPLRCAKGLTIVPDHGFADAPPCDVLLVPGGRGSRVEMNNPAMIGWIAERAQHCEWVTSVCTGVFLLIKAGPAAGRQVTTHWRAFGELPKAGDVTAMEGYRFVRDGNLVTSAGVSAGIDMSLWLLGEWFDPAFAREVQKGIEYFPAPPYAALA